MLECLTHVAGGMESIGGNDDIKGMLLKSLLRWIALNVEFLILHIWIVLEALFCPLEKAFRDIGKDVVGSILWEMGKQKGGGSSCASSDLQDTERFLRSPLIDEALKDLSQYSVDRTRRC